MCRGFILDIFTTNHLYDDVLRLKMLKRSTVYKISDKIFIPISITTERYGKRRKIETKIKVRQMEKDEDGKYKNVANEGNGKKNKNNVET